MKKMYKIALLRNEDSHDSYRWEESLRNCLSVDFDCIDFTSDDWFEKCMNESYDAFVAKPPGKTSGYKQLYDERIKILDNAVDSIVYPTIDEILIYESKRYLSYYLKAKKIPYPRTWVFYKKKEAELFFKTANYPIVGKINIGAAGNGVTIIKSKGAAHEYAKKAFSNSGIGAKVGPKFGKVSLAKRVKKVIKDPSFIKKRLSYYKEISDDKQRGFILLQEFIEHDFEWRCVRIGESFFAHKKVAVKGRASGTLEKGYENPPEELLDFIKKISDKNNLTSLAIDVFESPNRRGYLINEMQTIFGQSDSFQMKVNGKIGRYIYSDGWQFEEGDFNTNESYDLRLKHVISLLDERNKK